jgi:hypothetical protein
VENPFKVIDRICEQKGVHPREVLGWMLASLTSSHAMVSRQPLGQPKRSIADEISGAMQLTKRTDVPASVLAAVDVILSVQELCDRGNVAIAKQEGVAEKNPERFKATERKLAAEQAARLIMKELINQSERQSLKADIRLDEMIGPDGKIDFNKPDEPKEPS